MREKTASGVEPYIPASTSLPEITFKAFILGILLAILMAGSNAYLVLKVGISVTACIPAAVISIAVLKLFRKSNILENNIVQTTASAGEVIACALAFTVPAMVMIGNWHSFPYTIMVSLAAIGGLLGVFLSVPLRRAMIIESGLKFPEGIATAEVLKAGGEAAAAKGILFSGFAAAIIKFCQSGLQILADSINIWGRVGNTVVGVTAGFSLALVGAGYVVGLEVAFSTFVGAILAWFIGVPLFGAFFGLPEATDAYSAAVSIWDSKIRIIGVGMIVFGGLWLIIELIDPLRRAMKTSIAAVRKIKTEGRTNILRTEFDIPITYVVIGAAFLIIPIYLLFNSIIAESGIPLSMAMVIGVSIVVAVLAFVMSALGSAIAAYICGILGTSSSPFSGIILMGILILSLSLLLLIGPQVNFITNADAALRAGGITILGGAIIGCAVTVAGDNLQDLKSGQLVGATPWKQQLMLIVGVLVSAVIVGPIFEVLFQAYGFGDVLPREGMDPAKALSAPKAALMAAVTQAIFTQSMDWTMVITGVLLGIVVLLFDKALKKAESKWRLPVVAVAVGMYMPLDVTMPLLFGGILSAISQKTLRKAKGNAEEKAATERRGILFASGLIAGEAIVGILIAIPFVAYQSTNVFKIVPEALAGSTDVLGLLVILAVIYWFYGVASKVVRKG
ncbi:MAG: oligopeptide transporter, OPT family [Alphaproteobacteria bacterium 41-28]|nr:MAG: oligopeptide transporter, OPT family [Alphaproteobacteria bacterium 41-28]